MRLSKSVGCASAFTFTVVGGGVASGVGGWVMVTAAAAAADGEQGATMVDGGIGGEAMSSEREKEGVS